MNSQFAAGRLSANEWLEADGLGGFASGTSKGIRTRRYHALLLVARTPPTGRMVLVNGVDAWVETKEGNYDISSQNYAPGIVGAALPHTPRGCPFQAWSLGEILRLDRIVLAAPENQPRSKLEPELVVV